VDVVVEDSAVQTSLVGKKIGNYVVSKLLGEGGMGAVYLASHPDIGLDVAVKVLRPELCASQEAADRFLNEAKAVTRIQHPNIIRISDFGKLDNGHLYYVMEALQGSDLAQILEKERLFPAKEVLAHLEQICPALQAAHDGGVIHRDMKPDNIFVVSREPLSIKILDFGLAKLLQSQHDDGIRTSAGIVMGTPLYIAPEQAAGDVELIDARTDLYSFGVIIYQMLSGQLPITGGTTAELLFKQVSAPATPLRDVAPHLSPAIAKIVHQCMEKDLQKRPESATVLLQAFRTAVKLSNTGQYGDISTLALEDTGAPGFAQPVAPHSVVGVSAPKLSEGASKTKDQALGNSALQSVVSLDELEGDSVLSLGAPKVADDRTWQVVDAGRPVRRQSGPKTGMIAIVALVICALGGGAYFLLAKDQAEPPTPKKPIAVPNADSSTPAPVATRATPDASTATKKTPPKRSRPKAQRPRNKVRAAAPPPPPPAKAAPPPKTTTTAATTPPKVPVVPKLPPAKVKKPPPKVQTETGVGSKTW